MLSPNRRFSHLPQCRNLQLFHFVIRFYISIEDGECVVERDLVALKSFNDAHQNVNNALADDLMLLRSDPIEVNDVCPDGAFDAKSTGQLAVGSCSRLGSKSKRWATLWRQVYGARLGCYRRPAPSECGRRPGSYVAAKHGVLAAAEYAVASQMQRDGVDNQDADALTHLGVSTSFLKSAIGDKAKAYNNVKLKRFEALTKTKKLTAHFFMGRHLAARKKWKESEAAKSLQKLTDIK